jgi:two-component system NtrC family response regulator
MSTGRILIVEDDDNLRRLTQIQLNKAGFEVNGAVDVRQALEIMMNSPADLVISDLNLPGESGLELLKRVRIDYPDTTVVIVTAYGTVQTAVEAMRSGAYDYLAKPVRPLDLESVVNRAMERHKLMDEVRLLRSINLKSGFENIVGHSSGLMHVLEAAARVAVTDATVLIEGETGTGKELLSRAIHNNSLRKARPFVVINCGAIPHDLLESELFGHLRGSFTGAFTHKKGKVEIADGGTVFLDEISEMPMSLQVRILRLIQEREIEKVGGSGPTPVDVRIIAATNRDLTSLIRAGTFREDLYFRLAVVPLTLPPLRDRSEDIPEFVLEFFSRSTRKHNRPDLHLPYSLLPLFSSYEWPGNIRQLQNAVERMVVLSPGPEITVADLPEFLRASCDPTDSEISIRGAEGMTLDNVERQLISQALGKCDWNQSQAARHLGVTRKKLIGRMTKYGLARRESFVSNARVA